MKNRLKKRSLFYYLWIAAFLLFFICDIYIHIRSDKIHMEDVGSIADLYMTMMNWDTIIAPLPLFVGLFLQQKMDSNLIYVIRHKQRSHLWRHQFFKQEAAAFIAALTYTVLIVLIGWMMGYSFINWDKTGSIFYIVTGQVTEAVSFGMVLGIYFIFLFVKFSLLGSIFTILHWLTGSMVYGFIGGFIFMEMMYGVDMFKLAIDYYDCLENPYGINKLIIPLIVVVLFFFIGRCIVDKVDIYDKYTKQ